MRIIVGSPGSDVGNVEYGGAHVFELRDGAWIRSADLIASDRMANHGFGLSVAVT
jgi:hypothetical protein